MARVVTREVTRDVTGRLQERRDGRCYVVATRGASKHVMKDGMKVTTRDVARVVTRDLSRDVTKNVTRYATIDATTNVVMCETTGAARRAARHMMKGLTKVMTRGPELLRET